MGEIFRMRLAQEAEQRSLMQSARRLSQSSMRIPGYHSEKLPPEQISGLGIRRSIKLAPSRNSVSLFTEKSPFGERIRRRSGKTFVSAVVYGQNRLSGRLSL